MKKTSDTTREPLGFSLAEMLAALTIGAMVLVAVLSVYSRVENSAAAITRKLDSSRLPSEVLQRIAEDLDRIIASGSGTKVTLMNTVDRRGYSGAKLTIQKTIRDFRNRQQTFEEIIWQTSYDYDSDANGLILYRSHKGMAPEDKLLDEEREGWENEYSFVPICSGVTFFKIQVPKGEDFQDMWTSSALPPGIVVTISFAELVETLTGEWEVPDSEKVTRTIAIDRVRKIKFTIVKKEETEEGVTDMREGEESREDIEEGNEERKF